MKGGNRELRKDIIAFGVGDKMIPFDLYTEDPLLLLKKIKCILNLCESDLRIAFKDETGDKQIHIRERDRLYLKLKRMRIDSIDKDLFEDIWKRTGSLTPPSMNHHFFLLLLCVKGVFKNKEKDLELILFNIGIKLDKTSAMISFPDHIDRVFRHYINQGRGMGYPVLESVKTNSLSLSYKEQLIHLLEILSYTPLTLISI